MTQHLYRKQHVVTSVVAVIVDEADRVLLTRRAIPPFLGMWVMPGGKIDLGEPILRALHREVREEVGLEVAVDGLVDVFEHLTPDTDHFVILYYRCRPLTHALMPNPAEVAEARWVPRAGLASLSMTEGSRFILGKLFPELPLPMIRDGDGESGEG
jgi:8-oxo-dGTP diphosphatase